MLSIIKNWLFRNKIKKNLFSKLTSTIVLVSFFYSNLSAQNNLVPNGSFESYSTCPTATYGEINKATPWFQPNYPYAGAGGSSDFVHFCSGLTCNDVQQCPRTGSGLAGIFLFWDSASYNIDKWREYIEVGLTDSLLAGKKYCVRFYVNKCNKSGYPIKQIQAVLTNDSLLYTSPNYDFIPSVTPILEASSIINDTLNWVQIDTTFIANGGEKFFTIGNFSPGSLVNYLVTWPYGAPYNSLGYYYFDDISIYQQPDIFAGNDTIIPPGDSVQLGIIGRPDIFYSWSPITGLSNSNIANPMATPSSSTIYILTITDTNQLACTNIFKDTVIVQVGYVGVNENDLPFDFNLSPNPVDNGLFVECKSMNAEFVITDILGKEMNRIKIHNAKMEFDVSDLKNGIYFIRQLSGSVSKKIIVLH